MLQWISVLYNLYWDIIYTYAYKHTHIYACTPQDEIGQLEEVISLYEMIDNGSNSPSPTYKNKL